ncbi:hypothetical protein C0993_005974 [Termitomyces sp. T159_Od127]|nr:hypothetical protein C0993_005974 [Termitomyces sp. T159_Od127]
MLPISLSWWKSSKGPTTNMSKNRSDEVSDPTKSESKEGQREMSCDGASGGKDNQGISRFTTHQEESMPHGTAPSTVITKPESSYPRGRQASDQSHAKDPLAISAKRGTGHFQHDRKYSEALKGVTQQYTRTEKEEVRSSTKIAGLVTVPAQPNDLRKRLEESERQRVHLSKELDHGKREKNDLENKLAEAQREIHALRQKCDQTEEESRRKSKALDGAMKETEILKNDMDKVQRQIKDLMSELEATHRQLDEYAVHCERQDRELWVIREQLQSAETVYEGARKQLMERTAELQSAQVFLDAADSLSGADIINMTTALNAEILQISAVMADSLDYARRQREVPKERLEKEIGKILTQALINRMSVDGEDVDPTLVQLALQVCLVRCCGTIITSWTLEGNDERLSAIYLKIWKEEKQPVAGRWRSMTRMHATVVDVQQQTLQMITRAVERVLIAANTNDHPSRNQFQDRLSTIKNLSLQLRSSIGQHITSLEICPFMVKPGLPFDPNQMEDTYARERQANSMTRKVKELVAGSTELGLIHRVKDIEGKVEKRIMLKPKGGFTPIGLTILQSLAERGAHIIALSPHPIDSPEVTIIISLLRETCSNQEIYAEQCDLSSPSSIRSFCTRFLTGSDQRIDAIVFAHEYNHIGSSVLVSRTQTLEDAASKREAASLATFLITTLILPALLVAPTERDIRVITVVNPFYAAAVGRSFSIPFPSRTSELTKSIFVLEGNRSLRTTILTRHLQRILDALPAAQVPKTDEGSSPLLRIFTKSPTASVQTVLHALFLPTPYKVLSTTATKAATINDGTPIDASVSDVPEEVLKPGALYAECAVVRLAVPTPSETPTSEKKSQKGKGKELEEVLEIPDDGEYGGEVMGRLVWEAYEDALKAWELANPPKEAKETAPDIDQDYKPDSDIPR